MTLAALLAAATATAVGTSALLTARGVRRQIAELRAELAANTPTAGRDGGADRAGERDAVAIPAPRAAAPAAEIRAAVADALAEERERELAEARAFWAAQEARDTAAATDSHPLLGRLAGLGEEPQTDLIPYVPRQADPGGVEPLLDLDALGPDTLDPAGEPDRQPEAAAEVGTEVEVDLDLSLDTERLDTERLGTERLDAERLDAEPAAEAVESAELAAARRRHPSHPDFSPHPGPADHDRTVARLTALADARIPLADVRPGPLGTLDVYVFADGTTVCMTPGHRETAERLADALLEGPTPVLLGSSGVLGAYALTFGCGDEQVYVLADRVIASL
ncbi:secreted protein [Streptomyces bingchenggensis BCW-1]|uniref:Secreted protein n=1 Tax=Streptomyces bingchenggensis (strain BCW-1) TaxID=749414 RepID=D7BX98_STRBB|nr:secreted protein [Streptomyces bingchenggensis BCW-1]